MNLEFAIFRFAVLLALAPAHVVSAQTTNSLAIGGHKFDAGHGWTVGFTQGGAGCIASARYRDQTRVWFGVSAKLGNFVAFANPAWKTVAEGGGYEIFVQPYGRRRWRVETTGVILDGERGVLSKNLKLEVMEDLASAAGFAVELAGRRIFGGELSGSRNALNRAFQCFETNKSEAERIAANWAPSGPSLPEPSGGLPRIAGNGTGFFVTSDGFILTNEHVTRGCRSVSVSIPGLPSISAVLKASDRINDLSLLQVAQGPASVPSLKTGLRLGEEIAVFGYPLASVGVSSSGNFTMGYVSALAGLHNDTREYQISAPVQPGNSGGPLVDQSGNVVGVVNAKLNALAVANKQGDIPQNVNFAIKASVAQNFLETNGVTIPGSIATRKLAPTDLAIHLKNFTVKVDCLK